MQDYMENHKDYNCNVCVVVLKIQVHVRLFLFRLQPAGITATLEPRFTLSCNWFQLESVIETGECCVKLVEVGSQRLIPISAMIATVSTS